MSSTNNVMAVPVAKFALGILVHIALLNVLVELYIYRVGRAYLLGVALYIGISAVLLGTSTVDASRTVLSTTSLATTGLLSSMLIYRSFFHRLGKFPGPFLARLSKFHSVFMVGKRSQWHENLRDYHDKFGPIVRTGPRELSILRADAVPLIYGPRAKCGKSSWYLNTVLNHRTASVHEIRDQQEHRPRGRTFDQAMNGQILTVYEPRIVHNADFFVSKVAELEGAPFDANEWTIRYSFDVMGEVGFNQKFNNVKSGSTLPAIATMREMLSYVGFLGHLPWLMNILSNIQEISNPSGLAFTKWIRDTITARKNEFDPEKSPSDVISFLLLANTVGDGSGPSTETALIRDGILIGTAGSDTTAMTLMSSLYYLAKHPRVASKLQSRLDNAFSDGWSYEKAKDVSFLDCVLNETLRLRPVLATGGTRCTPREGIDLGDVLIPGDVNVVIPTELMHRSPEHFPRPDEFIPERWSGDDETLDEETKKLAVPSDAPFFPFSGGWARCPGKNLALMNLRIVLSKLMSQFDVALAEGETGKPFETQDKDCFVRITPPLYLTFTKRKVKLASTFKRSS